MTPAGTHLQEFLFLGDDYDPAWNDCRGVPGDHDAGRGDVVLRQGATTPLSPALVRSERHVASIRFQEIETYGDGVRRCPSRQHAGQSVVMAASRQIP
jgi:hypothetical protein